MQKLCQTVEKNSRLNKKLGKLRLVWIGFLEAKGFTLSSMREIMDLIGISF